MTIITLIAILIVLIFVISLIILTTSNNVYKSEEVDDSENQPILECKKKTPHVVFEEKVTCPKSKKIEEKPSCPNLDDYIHRSVLKSNMYLRSNPYYLKSKTVDCPKCPECPKSPKKSSYDYSNIDIQGWVPALSSECEM